MRDVCPKYELGFVEVRVCRLYVVYPDSTACSRQEYNHNHNDKSPNNNITETFTRHTSIPRTCSFIIILARLPKSCIE